jgi:hypothetical protein
VAKACTCTQGRVESARAVGRYMIRIWVCRCPRERRWTTTDSVRDVLG